MIKIAFLSLLVLATQATEALSCTLAAMPRKYKTDIAYFIANPTGKTVTANSLEKITRSRGRGLTDTSYANGDFQTFEADKLYGNPKVIKTLDSVFKKQKNRTVVGVFWGVSPECHRIVDLYKKVGKPVVFTTVIRPEKLWINGMPTFDFHIAKNDIYNPEEPQWKDDFKSPKDFIERYKGL